MNHARMSFHKRLKRFRIAVSVIAEEKMKVCFHESGVTSIKTVPLSCRQPDEVYAKKLFRHEENRAHRAEVVIAAIRAATGPRRYGEEMLPLLKKLSPVSVE